MQVYARKVKKILLLFKKTSLSVCLFRLSKTRILPICMQQALKGSIFRQKLPLSFARQKFFVFFFRKGDKSSDFPRVKKRTFRALFFLLNFFIANRSSLKTCSSDGQADLCLPAYRKVAAFFYFLPSNFYLRLKSHFPSARSITIFWHTAQRQATTAGRFQKE